MRSGMREGRFEDVVENDKERKNESGEAGEIKAAEADGEREGSLEGEQQQAREGEGKRKETSWQITFPQRVRRSCSGTKATVGVGLTRCCSWLCWCNLCSGTLGLRTQGCLSGEDGQSQARTHCGNRAALAA